MLSIVLSKARFRHRIAQRQDGRGLFRLVRLASFVNLRLRAEKGVDSLIRSDQCEQRRRPPVYLRLERGQLGFVCSKCARANHRVGLGC
jgi:hypothetical protein